MVKGSHHTKEARLKLSLSHTGKILSKEHRNNMSKARKGKAVPRWVIEKMRQARIGSHHTIESRMKMSLAHKGIKMSRERARKASLGHIGLKRTEATRKKISESQKGSKSHRWKGGVSPINKIIRKSVEFKIWREEVFKRDNWTCQGKGCGERGGNLHPHHLKPFSLFPLLRFEITNGITLCEDCHKKTDTYGKRIDLPKYKNFVT